MSILNAFAIALIFIILLLCSHAVGLPISASWVQPLASILAVVVALGLAIEQRFSAERIRREDRERTHDYHRAQLHFALSQLHSHAALCVETVKAVLDQDIEKTGSYSKTAVLMPRIEIHKPNSEAVRDIALCISSSSHRDNTQALSKLIQFTQIQASRFARLRSKEDRSISRYEVEASIVDAARLQSMAASCFAYARFQNSVIRLDFVPIEDSLIVGNIYPDDQAYEGVFNILKARKDRPWDQF